MLLQLAAERDAAFFQIPLNSGRVLP